MIMRSEIIAMAVQECTGISIRLADWLVTKVPLPWSDDTRRSLRRDVEFGLEKAMRRELALLTADEKASVNTDIMKAFDARIADLIARGSQPGHA